jgi:hypothetical protein
MERENDILSLSEKLRNQESIIAEHNNYALFLKTSIIDEEVGMHKVNETHLLGDTNFGRLIRSNMKFEK